MNKTAIASLVITYEPDISNLERSINELMSQTDEVLIIDNNSSNSSDVLELCNRMGATAKLLDNNIGLAALNIGFNILVDSCNWVVMMDQDSVLPEGYIDACCRYIDNDEVGIITARKIDANAGKELVASMSRSQSDEASSFINRTITSGSMVRSKAYIDAKGFDSYLFLDYVDFDFSVRVRQCGYKILCMNDVFIEHRLGETRLVKAPFHSIRVTEHSADREALIARNVIIYIRRYRKTESIARDCLSLAKHFAFLVFYSDRCKKAKALVKGAKEGLRCDCSFHPQRL